MALVWERPPSSKSDCRDPNKWTAYDEQSCKGYEGNLSGAADLVRFGEGRPPEYMALAALFDASDNPTGGRRRKAFLPKDFSFRLLDLDGDGYRTEFLLHVGNGPYAMIAYWVALGVVGDRLSTLEAVRASGRAGAPLVATAEAWESLALSGRGEYESYCGARCANTAHRWVIERTASHSLLEHVYWSCDSNSWTPGEPTDIHVCGM